MKPEQAFALFDDLDSLYGAYEALQVISAGSSAQADHCGAILCGLNYRFEALLNRLRALAIDPGLTS